MCAIVSKKSCAAEIVYKNNQWYLTTDVKSGILKRIL